MRLGLGERSDPCWSCGSPLELLEEDEHHDVSEYAEFHSCAVLYGWVSSDGILPCLPRLFIRAFDQ